MHFVDDVDPVCAPEGGVFYIFPKLSNIIDAGIRCPVDFDDIHGIAAANFFATFTLFTRIRGRAVFAIQRLRKNTGHCGLAHTTHS